MQSRPRVRCGVYWDFVPRPNLIKQLFSMMFGMTENCLPFLPKFGSS